VTARFTRIGRHRIPVKGIHPTLATFVAGARGLQERGHYCFWTAVLKRPVRRERTCTARALVLLPAGERFERMGREMLTARPKAAREIYQWWWQAAFQRGANVAYIRPATRAEVGRWAATHGADMQHAVRLVIGPPRRLPPPPPPPPMAWEGYG